jgi:hypothetical protein
MKTIQLKNKLGSALLSFAILFGLGLASSTTAQAQWGDDQYSRQQRQAQREQIRRQRQYEREQRRRARRNNGGYYGNNGGYNNGGYNNGGYNNGGYNNGRGNDGYGNYGGSFQLRQTALNAGANEGVKEGRKDRERGDRFDYTDESVFQNATKDYSSRLGDREAYRRYFREAFVNGYTEGYRGY